MNEVFFVYSGLINAITSVALGCFILVINFKSAVSRLFALFCFSVAYWAINYFLWLKMEEMESALFFIRHAMIGATFIPLTFTAFTLKFLEKHNWLVMTINILSCNLFAFCSFSPLFIAGVEQRLFFKFWPQPGILFHFMLVYFLLNAVYANFLLWSAVKKAKGVRRSQILYVFIGTFVGFFGGSTNYFLWYQIPIPPILNILVTLYIVTVAYAIAKFKLMDIQVIIRRTLVFAGLLAFVFAVFGAATMLVREVLRTYFGASNVWSYAISLFLIVLGYDPIRNLLVNLTDRYLFQKKYDYQKLLKDASRGIAKIESLQHLLQLVIHFITMRMRVKSAAILTRRDSKNSAFLLEYQRGYEKNFLEYRLDEINPLIHYLRTEKEAIDIERIKEYIEAGNMKKVKGQPPHAYDFHAIRRQMEDLQAACCVPSFLGRELRNILVLGEKKSGDYFTDEDLNVLFTLAQESAIAIENARLFDEAINKTKELEDINHQLEYAKNMLVKALSDTEAANKQLQDTQAQLIHEQKMATLGRLAASVGHEVNNPLTILSLNVSRAILKHRKNPELRVGEILDLFQKMEQNIGRIKAVVNTLTGLLKKSEKGKFEPLSLKLILEETLPLVQFQTYLDNLAGTEVEFDVPGNVPLIRGDLERLQEVFLNLFINAYHSMMGRRNPRIRVRAEPDAVNPQRVAIHFTDNGCGMNEEVMKKIFNYGFTTKPPGRGSGLGLYMCKYIIELHGGDIKVQSKIGQGTTFTLTLPVYSDDITAGGSQAAGTNDSPAEAAN